MDSSLANIVEQQTVLLRSMQEQIARLIQNPQPGPAQNINVPWPSPIKTDIDPEDAFKTFYSSWRNYCRATQMEEWSADQEPRKVSVLFSAIGEEALKKYGNFGITDIDKQAKTAEEILHSISSKMVPKKNIIYNRYIFLSREQMQYENFEVFHADLLKLVEDCDYKMFKEEMLRDKIVLGLKYISLKKELLKRDKLTLKETINLCPAAEATDKQMKDLSVSTTSEIKKVEEKKIKKGKCKFCGNVHIYKKEICPAWGKQCENCKGKNHLYKVCKKKKSIKMVKDVTDNHIGDLTDSDTDIEYIINKITNNTHKSAAKCVLNYLVNNKWRTTECLLDTAADECLIGLQNAQQMFGKDYVKQKIRPSKKHLFSFGGHHIIVHGEIDITLKIQSTIIVQEFSAFSKKWNFIQVTSSPHHPQGNGKAEAIVKIAKKLLLKATENGDDFWSSLHCLRNTPNKIYSSPVQRLFSRRTRGFLPIIKDLLKPNVIKYVSETIKNNKEMIKYSHDKKAKKKNNHIRNRTTRRGSDSTIFK